MATMAVSFIQKVLISSGPGLFAYCIPNDEPNSIEPQSIIWRSLPGIAVNGVALALLFSLKNNSAVNTLKGLYNLSGIAALTIETLTTVLMVANKRWGTQQILANTLPMGAIAVAGLILFAAGDFFKKISN